MLARILGLVGVRLAARAPIFGCSLPNIADHREYAHHRADLFAEQFLRWLRERHPRAIWTSANICEAADCGFSVEAGLAPPADRTLLAALKRSGQISHRQDVRIVDNTGRVFGKRTIWSFGSVSAKIDGAELATIWDT